VKLSRIAALAAVLLASTFAFAEGTEAVLTADGIVYTVGAEPAKQLEVVQRIDDERTTLVVPTTEDAATESDARLLWDTGSSTLYVVWTRTDERSDQILLARLRPDGTWSDPIFIATGGAVSRRGLTATLTRVTVDEARTAVLVHAAWWSMGANPIAEYALIAFENGDHISTSIADLAALAGIGDAGLEDGKELMAEVTHPPLAMARLETSGVDVVFGSTKSTTLTRVSIVPKLAPNARLWKPSREAGGLTPRAGLQSATGEPVKTLLSRGRIVLYAPARKFRFVIYDNGKWTPERMIQLDEHLTSEQLVQELRKALEQLEGAEGTPKAVTE
jgi:hypothetical protein